MPHPVYNLFVSINGWGINQKTVAQSLYIVHITTIAFDEVLQNNYADRD
jgi:hypothetical protein